MKICYESARNYLKILEDSLLKDWYDTYYLVEAFIDQNSTSLDEQCLQTTQIKLALLHPDHYKKLSLPDYLSKKNYQQIRGKRSFNSRNSITTKCQASIIWNYECQNKTEIQADHLFPYSMGGPTIEQNRINLCKYHNMVKSSDIHCFPWNETRQWIDPWLDNQIIKIRKSVYEIYNS